MLRNAIITAGLVFTLSAFAAEPPRFAELDTNRDGYLTPEEVGVIDGLIFDVADIDRNGKLDEQEYDDAVSG